MRTFSIRITVELSSEQHEILKRTNPQVLEEGGIERWVNELVTSEVEFFAASEGLRDDEDADDEESRT